MNRTEAEKKLKKYSQEHILRYYDELDDDEKKALLSQIDETDFSILSHIKKAGVGDARGEFAPLAAMQTDEINAHKDEFFKLGSDAIKKGEVAALLLAGGMGTRLGSDSPKGMYDIGLTKHVYIFERLIDNLMEVVEMTGGYPRLFIMTSEKNHDATTKFFKEKNYFGYPAEKVVFFKQDMAPACDYDGHIYLEKKNRMSTSPNGNAGWYVSMVKAGLDKILDDEGIKYINIFAVDNVLQRMADPVFVGACIDKDVAVGAKVVRKNAPDEKVGVMCLEDGRPSIVEYYELSKQMMDAKDENGDPAYNFGVILNYLFRTGDLKKTLEGEMPMHVVEKKIPYIDDSGKLIKPDKPNGYKFEQLVLDMIHMLDSCLPYEVEREYEFAPIKNKTGNDSVVTARELCRKNGIEL